MPLHIKHVPFTQIVWHDLPQVESLGASGRAWSQTVQAGDVRIRLVIFSSEYDADHWCSKGHVVFVLEGELTTILKDGRRFLTKEGESFCVGDDDGQHQVNSSNGAKLLIVD